MSLKIKEFFDIDTATFSFVISCTETNKSAIIDSVLNYDPLNARMTSSGADKIIDYIKNNNMTVDWILETHIHADHLTAASYLKTKLGGKIALGSSIKKIIPYWTNIFNTKSDTPLDGSQFDYLFCDNEEFFLGRIPIQVLFTPGHTPACACYYVNKECVFVGDTLLMPDVGAGRADFPGGSAKDLFHSIQKIYALPNDTKVYTAHDYPPNHSRDVNYASTVLEQKLNNILITKDMSEENFISIRTNKDIGNTLPRLLFPSIQFNLRAGSLGQKEENEIQYIKIPVNKF